MKTIKFFTLGCKVNQYDTQVIREGVLNSGFREIGGSCPADVYLINTCTVTQRADSASFNLIRRATRENPQARVIVTGCLTELDAFRIKDIPGVTSIVRNKDKEKIRSYLSVFSDAQKIDKSRGQRGISYFKNHTRAFLKIQDGCNNLCSYCKVPLVRGASRSRPLPEIMEEASCLARNGFKEIVLSGICLGAYGKDLKPGISLAEAIDSLESIPGLLRIRLSSIEAGDVSERLIDKIAESSKLCRHLHIPIQSGDDEILQKMNRNYRRQDYLLLAKRIKSRIPDIAITTDVLVGFPGEKDSSFRNTVDLIKELMPLKVHIFPYSKRAGTPAAYLKTDILPDILKGRIAQLKRIASVSSRKYKSQFMHKEKDVLIEGRYKKDTCFWHGYTDNYLRVFVKSGLELQNRLIRLRLKKVIAEDILGQAC